MTILQQVRSLHFFWDSHAHMLSYCLLNSGLPVAVKIKTDGGLAILINQLRICDFSQDEILSSQPIDMDQHLNKNVKSSVNKFDAVNKTYADRIKCKRTTGIIPNIAITYHILFTFPGAKSFASGKM